jgi:hypothetical protein
MESGGGMTSVSIINILERNLSVKSSEWERAFNQSRSRVALLFRGQLRRATSMLREICGSKDFEGDR